MKTALIIDDERSVRFMLEEVLSRTHQCSMVCSGKEGYRLAAEDGLYDIITMDLAMPEWDGTSALAMIDTFNPQCKIIVITGNLTPEDAKELDDFHCVRKVLQKPLSLKEFERVVEEVERERPIADCRLGTSD